MKFWVLLSTVLKNTFTTLFYLFVTTLSLFLILETVFYLQGVPQGASRFVERIVLRENLSPKKPRDEYRIFTYGESTMYGAHYGAVSSPARWLEAYLKDFLPDKQINVVNFARLGCGSHFIYNTFKQTLVYKPDLVIFYVGHNSFLPGNRKDQIEAKESHLLFSLHTLGQKSRFFSGVYRWVIKQEMRFGAGKLENSDLGVIESLPLGFRSEDVVTGNNLAYWENVEFTKRNILKILRLAKENGIPVIFLKPVCNLKDFAPAHSVHVKELTPAQLMQWEKWYEVGKEQQSHEKLGKALSFYEKAYAIDNTFADLSFRMGQVYFKMGAYGRARQYFEEARDNDAVINRATKHILGMFEELEIVEDLNMIDTEKVLISEVTGGILGEPVIEDNVHFSLRGHYLIGRALAMEMAENGQPVPRELWQFNKERSYDDIAKQMGINRELLISAYLKSINYFGSRLENRVRFAQKVLEIDPANSQALRHLAWAYWLMGEQDKALEVYKKLERVDQQSLSEVFKFQPQIKKAFRSVRLPAAAGSL